MTYKEFRKSNPLPSFTSWPFIDSVCCRISPLFSIAFIKRGVKPNTITLFMIISGIVGGVVLMFPFAWCKCIAGFVYLLWYIFDCSDGEVARSTTTFSKGGKYLDWCAHLITHPLFSVAMWYSFVNMGYSILLTTVLTFLLIISELLGRNRISMDTLYGNIDNTPFIKFTKMGIVRYVYSFFVYLPNMIIILPFVLGITMFFGTNWFYWFYLGWGFLYSVALLRVFIIFIWRMYKSE